MTGVVLEVVGGRTGLKFTVLLFLPGPESAGDSHGVVCVRTLSIRPVAFGHRLVPNNPSIFFLSLHIRFILIYIL